MVSKKAQFNLSRIAIVLAILILFFIGARYNQATKLQIQGKKLLGEGMAQEAILLYQKALSIFPLRFDIASDLEGARLILRSDLEYERIYKISTVQLPPPITPRPELKQDEIFVPILMYHHIRQNPVSWDVTSQVLNVNKEQLEIQLKYLTAHGYHVVRLNDLYNALNNNGGLPLNPVVLTFDDGYRDFYENAYPLLKKYNLPATMFVITAVVDTAPYLTWSQIAEMDASGLVQFGAHTRHHPALPYLSKDLIVDEIAGSKKDLEAHLKKPVLWFCYPYGSYGGNVIIDIVKQAGYIGAAATIYDAVQSKDKLFTLPRIGVDGRFSLENLVKRITW